MNERGRGTLVPWGRLAGLTLGLFVGLGAGLAACGGGTQTGFVATNPPPRSLRSRAVAEVALIEAQDSQALARAHVEVGLIEVLGDDGWSAADQAEAREALRRRAAAVGCDAVALLGQFDWIDTVESSRSSRERHGYRGVCLVYP
jgi:hypothetical protein